MLHSFVYVGGGGSDPKGAEFAEEKDLVLFHYFSVLYGFCHPHGTLPGVSTWAFRSDPSCSAKFRLRPLTWIGGMSAP
jgi:hypothetical protein